MTVERTDRPSDVTAPEAMQGEVVDRSDIAALRKRVSADRAELTRTVSELAGRLDFKGRVRRRAVTARDSARLRVSELGSRVRRPILTGVERTLRRVSLALQRLGARLRGAEGPRQLPPGNRPSRQLPSRETRP